LSLSSEKNWFQNLRFKCTNLCRYGEAGYAIYGDVLGSPGNADLVLGLITVVAGVGGTIIGGVAVDKVGASIGRVGWHFSPRHFAVKKHIQSTTASMVHVINLTPRSGNPSRAYGQNTVQSMTASMLHAITLTPPGE
jgi:hypothetical protein